MTLYPPLATLPLRITGLATSSLQHTTRGGWTRWTIVVALRGPDGEEGLGEDVGYLDAEQDDLLSHAHELPVAGTFTLAEFSRHLDRLPLFTTPPTVLAAHCYRRWAFESAALDLALKQAGISLAQALGMHGERAMQPVHYVVSLGLGDERSTAPLVELRRRHPGLHFKLDLAEWWTPGLIADLARIGGIDIVDFKGQYRGAFRGPIPDGELYRNVARGLPDAWLEDPAYDKRLRAAFAGHAARVTWDAPIHSVADILLLETPPRALNMKPSRFGLLEQALRAYELCAARGIALYGGGQFELGPGREQIQCLASLFHPNAPNDVAPVPFHGRDVPANVPASPLPPRWTAPGFGVPA
jgi:L-alanine-DL-glutamate epimerase-like enolase superfamily enzyme